MPQLSGKLCAFSDGTVVAAGRSWKITETANQTRMPHSGTSCALESYPGVVDWTGTCEGIMQTGSVFPIMPCDTFTFTGSVDGTDGVSGPARCTGIQIDVDYMTSTPVAWTANIAMNGGALTPGAAALTDSAVTVPTVPKSFSATVQTGTLVDSPVFTALPDVTKFTLNITEQVGTGSTADIGLTTYRTPGNLDITASVEGVINDDDVAANNLYALWPDTNEVTQLRAYVNATEFFDIQWMRSAGFNPGAACADLTIPITMPFNLVTSATIAVAGATKGELILPDLTSYWPA